MSTASSDVSPDLRHWQRRVFVSVWITYFAFYLCRANMSLAKKPLCETFSWDAVDVGWIFTALTLMYAIGQFVNGQLADRFGARRIVTLGITVSVAMNLAVFAVVFLASPKTSNLDHVLLWLVFFWGINGFFQAMGWSPMVRVMAHWFETEHRGRVMGALGTCYQFGGAFSWFLAFFLTGYYVEKWGGDWRAVFWVPALLFAAVGVYFHWSIRNRPEDVGLPTVNVESEDTDRHAAAEETHPSILANIMRTLSNPYLWIVAGAFFMLDVNRYGFVNWLPSFLEETAGGTYDLSALGHFKEAMKICIHPLAGSLGAVLAGWATDRFFGGRRAPVIAVLLLLLGLLTIALPWLDVRNTTLVIAVVALIGFCTYGPHILMVGHAAQDFGRKSGAAGAAGFIDGMGYIGASLAGVGAGRMIDIPWLGYRWTFVALGVAAILGAGFAALIWGVDTTSSE
ncbi:MAG: MFS transporter [Pirellulales bacterium]|nr:MFS transporter [Pirellulales bacterium]